MSVQQFELVWRKSSTGSSDGGAVSGVSLSTGVKNDLWPNIADADRVAGITSYKKIFACNDNATDDLVLPGIWVFQPPTNIAQQIGLGFNDSADTDPAQGNMSAFTSSALLALVSDGADARSALIVGLNAGGTPIKETLALNGATEVLSTTTWSVVNGIHLTATDGARTVTAKQGHLGTSRGVIGPSKVACWLWNSGTIRANGILLPNLPGLSNYGIWVQHVVAPGAGGVRPDSDVIGIQEG